jgi:hypothetical protein
VSHLLEKRDSRSLIKIYFTNASVNFHQSNSDCCEMTRETDGLQLLQSTHDVFPVNNDQASAVSTDHEDVTDVTLGGDY